MKRFSFRSLHLLGFLLCAPLAHAEGTAVPDPNAHELLPAKDAGLGSDGAMKDADSYQARIGELRAPGGEAYLLALRVPTLDNGQRFKTVHLRTQLLSIAKDANMGPLANADLYALGIRDRADILPTDYYQGAAPDPKATLIQDNFLTPTSPVRTDGVTGPFVETSANADAALAKYLNDALAKGALPGTYVILRISYDVDPIPDGNNGYLLLSSGATGEQEPPLFTYTTEAVSKK
jgi:hypothetical protein